MLKIKIYFNKNFIFFKLVPDLTASIMEPLTAQMTEEKLKKKLEQQKAKAPPPGTSRILTRATRDKNKPTTPKSTQKPSPIPTLGKQTKPDTTTPIPKSNTSTAEAKIPVKKVAVDIVQSIKSEQQPEPEPVPVTDEWANLGDELDPDTNPVRCEEVMRDEGLLSRLKQRCIQSRSLMLEGKLEGAAMFREVCKILCNLLSINFNESDNDLDESTLKADDNRFGLFQGRIKMLEDFTRLIEIPDFFLTLQADLLTSDRAVIKEVCTKTV